MQEKIGDQDAINCYQSMLLQQGQKEEDYFILLMNNKIEYQN